MYTVFAHFVVFLNIPYLVLLTLRFCPPLMLVLSHQIYSLRSLVPFDFCDAFRNSAIIRDDPLFATLDTGC